MLRTGFASQVITPPREFPLAGYFNKRPNRGVYDDLYVKVLLVEKEGVGDFNLTLGEYEFVVENDEMPKEEKYRWFAVIVGLIVYVYLTAFVL